MATPPLFTELSLKVKLSPQAKSKLVEEAARTGRDIDAYASELLEHAALAPSVESLLAPLRQEFAESGVTDDQLLEQVNEARDEYHNSQRKASA